jgi:hypothetical protein
MEPLQTRSVVADIWQMKTRSQQRSEAVLLFSYFLQIHLRAISSRGDRATHPLVTANVVDG